MDLSSCRISYILFLAVIAMGGCSGGAGDGGSTGGTAPTILDMQTIDGEGRSRTGFARGSQLRLVLAIDDPDADVAGVWVSFYPGNDTVPFAGPDSYALESLSSESALYETGFISIPSDIPAGRYRFTAEVYDSSDLFSHAVYIWMDLT